MKSISQRKIFWHISGTKSSSGQTVGSVSANRGSTELNIHVRSLLTGSNIFSQIYHRKLWVREWLSACSGLRQRDVTKLCSSCCVLREEGWVRAQHYGKVQGTQFSPFGNQLQERSKALQLLSLHLWLGAQQSLAAAELESVLTTILGLYGLKLVCD